MTLIYKPPIIPIVFEEPENYRKKNTKIDFNSHIMMWGYTENNEDGENVENLAERNNMSLMHDANLLPSFNSVVVVIVWWKGCNLDYISANLNTWNMTIKSLLKAIAKTQHRPIQYQINVVLVLRMIHLDDNSILKMPNG